MKKFLSFMLALSLFLCATALADTEITVTGTGEVLVPADTCVISLGVSVREEGAISAQSSANAVIAAIRAALTEAGIPEDDISTGYISLNPLYDYDTDILTIIGYTASSTLAIRTRDMDNVGTIIDLAFAAGANTLDGISFSAEDDSEASDQALAAAVADARAKADILASSCDLAVTGVENISMGYTGSYESTTNNFRMAAASEDSAAATVVQAARIRVTASVTITFEAEKDR